MLRQTIVSSPAGAGTGVSGSQIQPATEEAATGWQKLLDGACLTLSKTPEALIPAISVTLSLTGRPDEARAIASLGRLLATQYGFRETVVLEGRNLTVRFSRPADGNVDTK
jgi:starvation-inducible outer membrane lipoprotein